MFFKISDVQPSGDLPDRFNAIHSAQQAYGLETIRHGMSLHDGEKPRGYKLTSWTETKYLFMRLLNENRTSSCTKTPEKNKGVLCTSGLNFYNYFWTVNSGESEAIVVINSFECFCRIELLGDFHFQ